MSEQEAIAALYRNLIDPLGYPYERLREELIWDFGYDKFFDLQSEAFKLISTGTKPQGSY